MKQTKLVNLCPHPIVFITLDGVKHEMATCPDPPRADEQQYTRVIHTNYGSISIRAHKYCNVPNMPEPVRGVLYVVGARIRDLFPERTDLISPSAERTGVDERVILIFRENFIQAQYDDMVEACSQPA